MAPRTRRSQMNHTHEALIENDPFQTLGASLAGNTMAPTSNTAQLKGPLPGRIKPLSK